MWLKLLAFMFRCFSLFIKEVCFSTWCLFCFIQLSAVARENVLVLPLFLNVCNISLNSRDLEMYLARQIRFCLGAVLASWVKTWEAAFILSLSSANPCVKMDAVFTLWSWDAAQGPREWSWIFLKAFVSPAAQVALLVSKVWSLLYYIP